MKWLLRVLGYKVVYVCEWGFYDDRYDSIDRTMGRPVHSDMRTAPPWAKAIIVPLSFECDRCGVCENCVAVKRPEASQ